MIFPPAATWITESCLFPIMEVNPFIKIGLLLSESLTNFCKFLGKVVLFANELQNTKNRSKHKFIVPKTKPSRSVLPSAKTDGNGEGHASWSASWNGGKSPSHSTKGGVVEGRAGATHKAHACHATIGCDGKTHHNRAATKGRTGAPGNTSTHTPLEI